MTYHQIDKIIRAQGACDWGAVSWQTLRPHLLGSRWDAMDRFKPPLAGVIVAAFPYYAGEAKSNIARYARGQDYHKVLGQRMERVRYRLQTAHPNYDFLVGVDASPLPERTIGLLAGLGCLGKNTLLLTPEYGSYVFLSTIMTNLPLEWTQVAEVPHCQGCNACIRSCPNGALTERGIDVRKCLSHLTQHKGDLTAPQAHAIAKHPYVWGCDICQDVCPHNKNIPITPLSEFASDLVLELPHKGMEHMSRRDFSRAYPNRAFTWRGPDVIRRNFTLQWFLE